MCTSVNECIQYFFSYVCMFCCEYVIFPNRCEFFNQLLLFILNSRVLVFVFCFLFLFLLYLSLTTKKNFLYKAFSPKFPIFENSFNVVTY